MARHIQWLLISLFLLQSEAAAHPYFTLRQGLTWTFDYAFQVQTTRKEFKQAETKGTITTKAVSWEERGGHKVLRFVSSYQGIPFMTTETVIWRREEAGVLYLGSETNAKPANDLKDVSDTSTYCRDLGSIRTRFIQPSPVGPYRTETIASSVK